MAMMIEQGGDGRVRIQTLRDDHEHWNGGMDTCGTCGVRMGPQAGRTYAVARANGWHIATWDGECFEVTSSLQSGDRWTLEQVDRRHLLPPLESD